ncbi:MAG: saccharopine dehydrogenase C-terminal domain-containing protein [Desulfatiglandales bacterium]
MKIMVLGAGMVGSAIAEDLAHEQGMSVMVVDRSQKVLEKVKAKAAVEGIQANLQDKGIISSLVRDSDLVISAVPGFMGFTTLQEIIKAGKDVVDISFFSEEPFLLDELAKSQGITAVVDCGVAPGLCNIIAGHVSDLLDQTDRYVCYVGGLPLLRQWPFEYKAVFSPIDVLEEYIRPARFIEYGTEVVRPALSDIELIDFPEIGTLEAFNTDGLRTLRTTLDIPFMREKTLRYPGHAQIMRIFRESGFLSTPPIEVDGQKIAPISVTSKLLFDQWKLKEGDVDFTVMQIVMEGRKAGKRLRYTYFLLDRYDDKTRTTSMARTTGYTCSIVARQIMNGRFTQKGLCAPEFIGHVEGCYQNLLEEYKKRNIQLTEEIVEHGEDFKE